ncbi:thioredoxin domain-containing protein [Parvularcula sp. IMCC14364]|uniref:thioredoxin domain-containing protein n=1 Tax=Parvularcula sp. IMCC14364 TaxID=3067902 RepID=UPI0027428F8B|nr:thioredoxin domain-containing protein [Parvularcula sp. IMCC14364]
MRHAVAIIALSFLAACSGETADTTKTASAEPASSSAGQEDAKVIAVLMYADWCGSCKVLDPKIQSVRNMNAIDGIEFTRLDYTARDAEVLFLQADAAGIGNTVRSRFADEVKTGLLLLVDADSGEILSEINKSMTEVDIIAVMTAAVEKV